MSRAVAALALAAAACATTEPPAPADPCAVGDRCAHPIDALVVPRLAALGVAPRVAAPAEYCRRLLIDLHGSAPTADEVAACAALPDATARVDAAMADERYLRTMRRQWGEVFGYDNLKGWTDAIVELDREIGALYDDALRYEELAALAVVHPGFLSLALHDDRDDWARLVFRAFLGRRAREDEIAGLRPVATALVPRFFCEGHVYWSIYAELLGEGLDPMTAAVTAADACGDSFRTEVAVSFCECGADRAASRCRSDVLGVPVALAGPCADDDDPSAPPNLFRLSRLVPGDDDRCPDGQRRAECTDKELFYSDSDVDMLRPLAPIASLDASGRAELDQIGASLVVRADFWDAAVDREARLLLGWWQTSFRQHDTDLPDVRRLLAARLRETGSVRETQRLLLTSVLYAAPAEAPPELGDRAPDFASGPVKLLSGEAWLDSAAILVGEPTGQCDHRFVTREGQYSDGLLDPHVAELPRDSFFEERVGEDAYAALAIKLGGCSAEDAPPPLSNVGLAFVESEVSRVVCAYGRGVVPAELGGDLERGARHVVRTLLGRDPASDEVATLTGAMSACVAAGAEGCADATAATRWLCRQVLESSAFSTY